MYIIKFQICIVPLPLDGIESQTIRFKSAAWFQHSTLERSEAECPPWNPSAVMCYPEPTRGSKRISHRPTWKFWRCWRLFRYVQIRPAYLNPQFREAWGNVVCKDYNWRKHLCWQSVTPITPCIICGILKQICVGHVGIRHGPWKQTATCSQTIRCELQWLVQCDPGECADVQECLPPHSWMTCPTSAVPTGLGRLSCSKFSHQPSSSTWTVHDCTKLKTLSRAKKRGAFWHLLPSMSFFQEMRENIAMVWNPQNQLTFLSLGHV